MYNTNIMKIKLEAKKNIIIVIHQNILIKFYTIRCSDVRRTDAATTPSTTNLSCYDCSESFKYVWEPYTACQYYPQSTPLRPCLGVERYCKVCWTMLQHQCGHTTWLYSSRAKSVCSVPKKSRGMATLNILQIININDNIQKNTPLYSFFILLYQGDIFGYYHKYWLFDRISSSRSCSNLPYVQLIQERNMILFP